MFYQSFDNKIDRNNYYVHENKIKVMSEIREFNGSTITLSAEFMVTKILTHPAFPGILFISNQTSVLILYSEFYARIHYEFEINTITTLAMEDPDFNFVVTSRLHCSIPTTD